MSIKSGVIHSNVTADSVGKSIALANVVAPFAFFFPFYIIRSTCNECNNGCNIVEQKQRKTDRNDSQKERQVF